jgi:Lon protease-like protein
MAPVLPIFPLDTVLLPGLALPLHIFEPRYRQLVTDVQQASDSPGFGVVAVRRDSLADAIEPAEAGSSAERAALEHDPALAAVGTLAEIIEVEPYEDGRSDLLTIGSRRFRVLDLSPVGKPYLQATVEWLPEEDGDSTPALLDAARTLCGRYVATMGRLSGREFSATDYADDPLRLSYQVAAQLRLPNVERQRLLEATTAAKRLRAAIGLLRREITLISGTRSVPVAPGLVQLDASPN